MTISILKDLPDVDGDSAHGVATFASKWGLTNASRAGAALLGVFYAASAALLFACSPRSGSAMVVPAVHVVALVALWRRTRRLPTDLKQTPGKNRGPAAARYYAFIWRLFYLEYCLLPLV